RRPATSTPSSTRSASRNPAASVLSPTSRSPRQNTQLTAPRAAATGVRSSTASWTAALRALVTESPAGPSVRTAATASPPRPSGTSKATYTQSRPVAAKAALRIVGDSECRTGEPMTAATRVRPVTGPPTASAAAAGGLAAVPGRQEVRVVVREVVGPVVLGDVEHVPPPVALGGCQRRLDAGPPGRGDRGRGQPGLVP